MNEDFVTFEQAVKLKELGFNWDVSYFYTQGELRSNNDTFCSDDGIVIYIDDLMSDMNNYMIHVYSAPTLAQAQKWLREVKGCKILITAGDIDKEHYGWDIKYKDIWLGDVEHGNFMESYEEALSDAIDEALDIIQEK